MRIAKRLAFAVLFTLALVPCLALAQDSKPAKPEAEVKPQPQPYLLTFTIKETFAGKAAVERSYTMTAFAGDRYRQGGGNIRDNDRFAEKNIDGGKEEFKVGTEIQVGEIEQIGANLIVNFTATSEMPVAKGIDGNFPETRNWRVGSKILLVPGKPTVVYSATDAVTDHKVEIVLTAKPVNDK